MRVGASSIEKSASPPLFMVVLCYLKESDDAV